MGSDIAMLYDRMDPRGHADLTRQLDAVMGGSGGHEAAFDEDWMRRTDLPPMQNGEPPVYWGSQYGPPIVPYAAERARRKAEGHDREAARAWMRQQEAERGG